jgi:AmiR/NasT family two-component response regulator
VNLLPHDLCELARESNVDPLRLALAIGMLSHLRQTSGAEAAAHLQRLAAEADVSIADLATALVATAS